MRHTVEIGLYRFQSIDKDTWGQILERIMAEAPDRNRESLDLIKKLLLRLQESISFRTVKRAVG
jgi:hypothetical protein